jgi:hypothetical protein
MILAGTLTVTTVGVADSAQAVGHTSAVSQSVKDKWRQIRTHPPLVDCPPTFADSRPPGSRPAASSWVDGQTPQGFAGAGADDRPQPGERR